MTTDEHNLKDSSRSGGRRGVSLLEMLVAIAIIGLLVALILPAIESSRESARRLQCTNNLRQFGLALQNYHEAHQSFPPGYSAPPVQEFEGHHRWSFLHSSYAWGVHLLPYLDARSLYDNLKVGDSLETFLKSSNQDAIPLVQTPLAVFRCPSDLAGETLSTAPIAPNYRDLNREWPDPTEYGFAGGSASYVANAGYFPAHEPYGPDSVFFSDYDRKTGPNNGLFHTGSHVSFAQIPDGASNTIAIGERAWFQGSATWVGTSCVIAPDPGGAGVCLGRVYWRINELPDPPGVFMTPDSKQVIPPYVHFSQREGFSSYHPGGAHFLLADGSVRFLNEAVESRTTTPPSGVDVGPVPNAELLGVFQKLGIRDDVQTIGEF